MGTMDIKFWEKNCLGKKHLFNGSANAVHFDHCGINERASLLYPLVCFYAQICMRNLLLFFLCFFLIQGMS